MLSKLTHSTMNQAAIHEADPYVRLSYAVLELAYRDVVGHKAINRRSAAQFFEGELFAPWAELAHVDPAVVLAGYQRVKTHGLPIVDARQERYAERSIHGK